MLNASQFANLILSFGPVTHKKLQKLCYYVYSWYLTIYNEKISNINFEAWVHGPVSREIYMEYKYYGWMNIPEYKKSLIIREDIIDFTEKIMQKYSCYSANELEKMTHKEKPWRNARIGYNKYDSSSEVIKDSDIVSFYRSQDLYKELSNEVKR